MGDYVGRGMGRWAGRDGTGRDGTGSGWSSRSRGGRSEGGNVAQIDPCLTRHAQVKFDFLFGETPPKLRPYDQYLNFSS